MAAPDISNEDWSGARFRDVNLCGAVLRAVDVDGMDIDSPWLLSLIHISEPTRPY